MYHGNNYHGGKECFRNVKNAKKYSEQAERSARTAEQHSSQFKIGCEKGNEI